MHLPSGMYCLSRFFLYCLIDVTLALVTLQLASHACDEADQNKGKKRVELFCCFLK